MKTALLIFVFCLGINNAAAREISVSITNSSAQAISGISIASDLSGPLPNASLGSEGVAPGTTATVDFDLPDELCVFDLTIESPGGQSLTRPSVDLCQTEAITIE